MSLLLLLGGPAAPTAADLQALLRIPVAGTYPAVAVQYAPFIDATAVPTADDWVDISAYVREVHVDTGRDSEWSGFGAGTCEIRLDNAAGTFDPDYVAGPLYGYLRPLMWVRVLAGTTTTNQDCFYGLVSIDGWQIGHRPPSDSECRITVVDAFETMANIDLPESAYAVEVAADSPTHWWRLAEPAGSTVAKDRVGGSDGTYTGTAIDLGGTALLVGDSSTSLSITGSSSGIGMTAPATVLAGTGAFSVEAVMGAHPGGFTGPNLINVGNAAAPGSFFVQAGVSPGVVQLTVYNDAGTTFNVNSGVRIDDEAVHHVVVTRSGTSWQLVVDGTVSSLTVTGTTTVAGDFKAAQVVNAGVTRVADVAIYSSVLSNARITAHYDAALTAWAGDTVGERMIRYMDAAAWPSGLRSIETGVSTMPAVTVGSRDLLTLLKEAETADGGRLYVNHRDAGKVRYLARDSLWLVAADLLTPNQRSLETNTAGWLASESTTTIARSTTEAYTGSASLSITRNTSAGVAKAKSADGTIPLFAVSPGRDYLISARFKAGAASSSRTVTVYVFWYTNLAGTAASTPSATVASGNSVTSGWTQTSGTVTPPEDARYAALEVWLQPLNVAELHYMDDAHVYSHGVSSQIVATFGNGTSEVICTPAFKHDRIINLVTASRTGGQDVVVEDTTSEATYQRRAFGLTGLQVQDQADVQGRAEWLVNTHSSEHRQVTAVYLDPTATTHAAWAEVFARHVADRVTVNDRPPYASATAATWECVIEGIRHKIVPGEKVETTFSLSPAPPPVFMWDGGAGWNSAVWGY